MQLEPYLRREGKIIDRFGQYIQLITMTDDMGAEGLEPPTSCV
jgi:hypothetical protein